MKKLIEAINKLAGKQFLSTIPQLIQAIKTIILVRVAILASAKVRNQIYLMRLEANSHLFWTTRKGNCFFQI